MKAASNGNQSYGEVVEWFIAAVLKTAEVLKPPGVRIPLSPPFFENKMWFEYFLLILIRTHTIY